MLNNNQTIHYPKGLIPVLISFNPTQ